VEGRVTQLGKPLGGRMVAFMPRSAATQGGGGSQTDENGHYSIAGLQPGDYNVRVVDMSSMQSYTTSYSVQGSATFDIEVRNSAVTGRVLDADSGQPIAEAAVSLESADSDSAMRFFAPRVMTGPDGTFRVDTVSPGNYHVRAEKSGYGQQIQDISVSESSAAPLELRLSRQDGVSVRVVDARDGRSLDGFFVALDAGGRQAYQGSGKPQSDGSVTLPLSAGSYRLIVIAPTYATRVVRISSPSAGAAVAMTPGGSLEVISSSNATQSGQLLDASGQGYPRGMSLGGEIAIRPGLNRWDNIAPGSYTVVVPGSNGENGTSRQVTVSEGQVARVQI
ncbi:MAG: carboxypeptidase-like regulatory domain-containing protein, partial [Acidobacteriota bacterium]